MPRLASAEETEKMLRRNLEQRPTSKTSASNRAVCRPRERRASDPPDGPTVLRAANSTEEKQRLRQGRRIRRSFCQKTRPALWQLRERTSASAFVAHGTPMRLRRGKSATGSARKSCGEGIRSSRRVVEGSGLARPLQARLESWRNTRPRGR